MKLLKKSVAYVLVFITVFSSFTILPSGFSNMADVSAVELTTEASTVIATNQDQITVEEPTTVETNKEEITAEATTVVETKKDDITVAESKAGEIYIEENYIYTIINYNEVKIVGYIGTSTDIVIPEVTKGSEYPELVNKKVTAIGDKAFYSKKLTSVIFGKYIKTIGTEAFCLNTALTKIDLSKCTELTEIGVSAFNKCTQLTGLEVGDNIEVIGNLAFNNCNKLKTVIIKGGNNATIGKNAFYSCDRLVSVTIGDGVQMIDDYAFAECTKLSDLTLGKSLKILDDDSFSGCSSLTEVTIPNSVEYIYSDVFSNCTNLKTVTIGNGCQWLHASTFYGDSALENIIIAEDNPYFTSTNGVVFNKDKTIVQIFPKTYSGKYIIPDTVTKIAPYAFSSCQQLTEVIICDSVKEIGYNAFSDCFKLSKINIPKGVTNIDSYVFSNAKELEELDMSECTELEEIPWYMFSCSNIKNVTLPKGITIIRPMAFYNCPNIVNITLPNIINEIGISAFENCSSLETITLGKYVRCIEYKAFKQCNALTSVYILNKYLKELYSDSFPKTDTCTIYCYKNSNTHKLLTDKGYTNIQFIDNGINLTNITVNGASVDGFNTQTKNYTVYLDNTTDVTIVPLFEKDNASYTVANENNVYTINIFDESEYLIDTYTVTVKEYTYNITGDVNLMLNNISATKVGGSIALQAGTYKLKIAKVQQQFGYNKVVADYCGGLTLSEKYSSYITLNATGGIYTFQFDKNTNKLVIKHDKNLPNEYLVGDMDTILKPVGDRPLSIGTQQLKAGTYKFKLSIGGKEYGYNKIVNDATAGSLSMNSKYTAQITLNATGGMYTFVLNTETNKLIIRHTPIGNESTTDVHISGTFNLVLNDKLVTGEELTTATGITYLEDGCYTFKVYNYGVAYTSGAIFNNTGKRTLSSQYTTPITLNATGGTYQFTFDKETGVFEVLRYDKYAIVGDINLVLLEETSSYVYNTMYLPEGTYKFKILGDGKEFGCQETDGNYSNIYLSEEYKSEITLVASGGMYMFVFVPETNKLGVWYSQYTPN